MEFPFCGLMAPVFTPFKESLDLDLEKIPFYAEYLKKNGIMGVLVNGTTGEGMSMTTEEREAIAETWVKASANTGQTLLIQVGGASLPDVQRMAKHAENLNVSGILCLPELFQRPKSIKELIRYLKYVSNAAPKTPLLYYHIPSLTGVNLDMGQFLNFGKKEIPTLAGIKFTHTDLEEGTRCLYAREPPFSVFLGADQILVGACILGFNSAIAISLNMFASDCQGILKGVEEGNNKKAKELQKSISDQMEDICQGSLVSSMKSAMKIITGLNLGPVRPPLIPLTEEQCNCIALKFCI